MDRRKFMKALGVLSASSIPASLKANEEDDPLEFVGAVVDTTKCIGCRKCEEACAEIHGFPKPESGNKVFEERREPSTTEWTVVNRFKTDVGDVFVKKQCMHCGQPACAAACPTKAMLKTKEGPVIWRSNKCMGCRYCMVSCPFGIPKFEYESPIPDIQKCNFCWERQQEGEIPACVEACPMEAIIFGKRKDVLHEAKMQIYKHPDKYYPEIYGEHEAGGTGWMYLSAVPFDQIGFRTDLSDIAYPEYAKEFLYAVPVVLALLPPFLWAVSKVTNEEEE